MEIKSVESYVDLVRKSADILPDYFPRGLSEPQAVRMGRVAKHWAETMLQRPPTPAEWILFLGKEAFALLKEQPPVL